MTTGKTIALTRRTFVGEVMSLLFNMLSRLVIAFLPRSKRLLISWLQSAFAVILEPPKVVSHCFHCSPIYLPWWDWIPWRPFFECWVSSQLFGLLFSPSSRGSLVPLHFLLLELYHLHIWGVDISPGDLVSSVWFTQSGILHDVLCIEVK